MLPVEGSTASPQMIGSRHLLNQGKGALPLRKKKNVEAQGLTSRVLLPQKSMLMVLITVEAQEELEREAEAVAQWRMHPKKRIVVITKGGALLLKKMGGVAVHPAQQVAGRRVVMGTLVTMRIEILHQEAVSKVVSVYLV